MVGQVRVRMRDRILGRGVVKIHICVDRIFKETGGSVHFLKLSLKFQGLNNKFLFFHYYEFVLPLSQYFISFEYAPNLGLKFCTKERRIGFGPLGVIYYSMI